MQNNSNLPQSEKFPQLLEMYFNSLQESPPKLKKEGDREPLQELNCRRTPVQNINGGKDWKSLNASAKDLWMYGGSSPSDTLEYSASEEPSGQPQFTGMDRFPQIPTQSLDFSDEEKTARQERLTPRSSPKAQRHSIQNIRDRLKIPRESVGRNLGVTSLINFDKSNTSCSCNACLIF